MPAVPGRGQDLVKKNGGQDARAPIEDVSR
jgi:hypothetical protein